MNLCAYCGQRIPSQSPCYVCKGPFCVECGTPEGVRLEPSETNSLWDGKGAETPLCPACSKKRQEGSDPPDYMFGMIG